MNNPEIIQSISQIVHQRLSNEGTGHDWWHIERVWKMARKIGQQEQADLFIVELAALLHDIADWKFHNGDEEIGPRTAREIMQQAGVDASSIDHVCDIIAKLSFKGACVAQELLSIEGKIVQDADRLDALGAIGIARAFAYGGYKNRPFYHPEQKPVFHTDKYSYHNHQGTTVNHFYEKLLLLKDRMHTQTARNFAIERHEFMEQFLLRFYKEWQGNLNL